MQVTEMSTGSSSSVASETSWARKIRRELDRLLLQANTLSMRPAALTTCNRFLFVLAHMRSGSSLLRYLLSSSDEVIGIGETHNNYRSRSDLAKLLTSIRRATGENPLKYRYVMDKIVASHHVLCAAVLEDPRTRYVFLVREPHATVNSIVAARRQIHDETTKQLVSYATDYYSQRLGQLRQFAESIDDHRRCLLLTHQELVGETQSAFLAIEDFLELRTPLRESYQPKPIAPRPDRWTSPKISLGTIDRSPPRHQNIVLPVELRDRLDECFGSTLTFLREKMQSIRPKAADPIRRAA